MFDQEKAIAAWCRFLASARGVRGDDLDELEAHLRDEIDALVTEGLAPEDAFHEARHRVGDYTMVEAAYERMYWRKVRDEHKLSDELILRLAMLTNYLKVAFRNLRRQPTFSLLNVLGLSIGLTCCLLIVLFVRHERSYDRFHEHADRIYRIALNLRIGDNTVQSATAPAPLGPTFASEFPEVEYTTRLWTTAGRLLVRYEDRQFVEEHFYYADSSFFDVFTFLLQRGAPQTALTEPYTVVLTESTAQRYFDGEDPIGKTITLDDGSAYRVTAIAADPPQNAHFQFDLLASLTTLERSRSPLWLSINYHTYIVLSEHAEPADLETKFPALIEKYVGPQINQALDMPISAWFEQGGGYDLFLQPLPAIHLHSQQDNEIKPGGDARYVYIFSGIALMILLIASVNFMNLATARSADRAREVGVRKVLGSNRGQLIRQFLLESTLLSSLALLLALALSAALLPAFRTLTGIALPLSSLFDPWMLAAAVGMALGIGLLAGSYPAFFLSAYRPAVVLKSLLNVRGGSARLRQGLIVFQFTISIVLIIGSLIIYQQVQFMQAKKLGFDKEHVVLIRRADVIEDRLAAFKEQVLQQPSVVEVSASTTVPGAPTGALVFQPEDAPAEEAVIMNVMDADYEFVSTLGMEILEGRDFSPSFGTDSTSLLINEAAAQRLGWTDPVGKQVTNLDDGQVYTIIGLVENFHFDSLREEIQPAILRLAPFDEPKTFIAVRTHTEQLPALIDNLEQQWHSFVPDQPFEYSFLAEDFDALFQSEQRTSHIISLFALLAMLVAGLGLFGLTAFTIERRTKEIGVRKVLGASVPNLVTLLSKDFLKFVLIAFIVALPVAYYVMSRWLTEFAYRIEISWPIFLVAGVAVLGVALVTVSYQAVKAALADPVKSLRYE